MDSKGAKLRQIFVTAQVFGGALMIGGVLLVARPPGLFDTRVDDFDVLGKIDYVIANKKGNSKGADE